MNRRNNVENTPKVPKKVNKSTTVGEKYPQLEGRKSRERVVFAITKRSNHMPTFTKMEMTQTRGVFSRMALNQNS